MNQLSVPPFFHAVDSTTTSSNLTHNVTHVFFRDNDVNLHDWFKDNWVSLLRSILQSKGCGNLEGRFTRVDFVVTTIVELSVHVNKWVTSKNTVLHSFLQTLFNGWDKFTRNNPTDNGIFEFEALTFFKWRKFNPYITVLTLTTRLTNELTLSTCWLSKCFTVGNLWLTNSNFGVEFTAETFNNDVQVQFTHPGNQSFTSFRVSFSLEGWIFFSQLLQTLVHLILVSLGLWFNRNLDNWFWEVHGFKLQWVVWVGQGVTSSGVLQTDSSGDITREYFWDFVLLVRVHLQQPTNPFTLVLASVQHVRTGLQ